MKYRDISTGKIVAELRTGLGRCDTMTQNPANAIINLGHGNGTVTLWSPNTTTPLVKMLCHRGPVKSIAVDKGGYYMATAGLDGQLKIWDIRTYKPVHEYFTSTPASTLAISDIGALAVGYGPHIAIWQDALKTKAKSPYLTHLEPGSAIDNLQFCPFEDMLAFGHSNGIKSLIVPGTGEPNFDSLEANPYQTKKQRQESEVHSLLDKIQPEMITIDVNFVGNVDRAATEVVEMERKREWEANHPEEKFEPRNKQRGKSSAHKKFRKKQTNVIDANKVSLLKKIKDEGAERELAKRKANGEDVEKKWSAFDRFAVAPMK